MAHKRFALVTGIAGFIGSHVTEYLCERGYFVVGIDNFNNYYSPLIKKRNAQEIFSSYGSDVKIYEGDIRDRMFIREILSSHDFDAIFHLAAMPGVRASIEEPELYYDINLRGTLILLDEIARFNSNFKRKCPKFIFASTSSVYGKTTIIPFREDDTCSTPLAPYPATKRSAELLGYTYSYIHRIPFLAIRFFTVYGPRNRPDMMAYKLMESIYHGKEIPLYNGGAMYRDWTYVEDIALGVVAALDATFEYEIVNLGRGEPILLLDFVQTVESLTGKKAYLKHTEAPPSDMVRTFADTRKASKLLNYRPKTPLKEGIEALVRWYENSLLANS
ncbi:MAG: GDP-mannose 4,6-dehydratase [Syntrophobacterales bacterium]|nr:GDP-mannose 4,6-dehydratase [Syntrophobacterales bacterium]